MLFRKIIWYCNRLLPSRSFNISVIFSGSGKEIEFRNQRKITCMVKIDLDFMISQRRKELATQLDISISDYFKIMFAQIYQ